VLLYDTSNTSSTDEDASKSKSKDDVPASRLVAQIGGPGAGISGRVKDFEILPLSATDSSNFLVITGSSDGTIRTWSLNANDLEDDAKVEQGKGFTAKQVGNLLGTYKTGTRVTCLKAFTMTGTPDEEEDEIMEDKEDDSSSDGEDV
jgi:protein MAK11